jgi:putative FmdB family regulatory protein
MPLYEYQCSDCNQKFDKLVSYTQSNNMECPNCQSKNTLKLISTFATIGGGNSGKNSTSSCATGRSPFT